VVTVLAHDHLELRGLFELAQGACQDASALLLRAPAAGEMVGRASALRKAEALLQKYFAHDFAAEALSTEKASGAEKK
jgi:hypothetical protein